MIDFFIAIVAIAGTILLYLMFVNIHKKSKSQFTLPILAVSTVIIIFLLIFNIPYETYMLGGKWIAFLMGPAVVALGYPLYNHFHMLKRLAGPIIVGTLTGAVIGVSSGVLLAKGLGFERELILALAPKSVTTPVAISIVEILEGPTSLAAVFVIIAGAGGVLISPYVFKIFHLNTPIGRGIGIGSASHAIGTASAMDRSDEEGSLSTIAMVLSAVFVSFLAPSIIVLLL